MTNEAINHRGFDSQWRPKFSTCETFLELNCKLYDRGNHRINNTYYEFILLKLEIN